MPRPYRVSDRKKLTKSRRVLLTAVAVAVAAAAAAVAAAAARIGLPMTESPINRNPHTETSLGDETRNVTSRGESILRKKQGRKR